MNVSSEGLAPYPGEPASAVGWRLGRAGWRQTRRSGSVAIPTLALAAVFMATSCLRIFAGFGVPGEGDPWVARLLIDVPTTFALVFLGAAIAAAAEAALDGIPLDPGETAEEVRDAVGPLAAFAGVWAALWIGVTLVAEMTDSALLSFLLSFAWYIAGFYAVPVVLLERPGPGEALAASWRLVRWHFRVTIGGLFALAILGGLLLLPGTALFEHAAAVNRETFEAQHGLLILAAIATSLAFAFAFAARECFAVSVYRLEVEDLPGVANGGVKPQRRTRAFKVARGFAALILILVAFTALTKRDQRILRDARAPGANYAIVVNAEPESVSSGSPVVYGGRQIGVVLGARADTAGLRVAFHVEPGFGPGTTPSSFAVRPCGTEYCLVMIPVGAAPEGSATL